MKLIVALCFFINATLLHAQKKGSVNKIDHLNGDLLLDHSTKKVYIKTSKIYKLYNDLTKDKILVTKGWLDTTKEIIIAFGDEKGSATMLVDYSILKSGYAFSPFDNVFHVGFDLQPITLRIDGNNLLIDADILGFGGTYLAKVRDNKLEVVTGKTFEPRYSSSYFEVFESENNIPVLQLELGKNNQIFVTGIFAYANGWVISSKIIGGILSTRYADPIKKMSKEKQDSLFDNYVKEAKENLKPIHERQ